MQIYFIDNDDYFARKAVLSDDAGWFADNDERAIFFARGVLETVKKLRWNPVRRALPRLVLGRRSDLPQTHGSPTIPSSAT